MKIELQHIKVRDLVNDYQDNAENGIVGFNGLLNIRPPYQREFIYKDKQRNAVIDTVFRGLPLNVMYWAKCEDGTFELVDGQQRTISICQFANNDFSINERYFHNLLEDEKAKFLDYEILVYICEGTESEKLEWFKTINIAGEKLTDQELRNAVYTGTWITDAKRYFSKTGCNAYRIGSDYINGTPIRQDYLEKALEWISEGNIEDYMARHQHDPNAGELWRYFSSVIAWIETTFTKKRPKLMKGVDWGKLYNEFSTKLYDTNFLETEIQRLILDDDVTNKKGIYPFLLSGKEKYLSIRLFTDAMKLAAYEKQGGVCPICGGHHELNEMEADHITPWSEGGKTTLDNCQMLCRECNRRKSNR